MMSSKGLFWNETGPKLNNKERSLLQDFDMLFSSETSCAKEEQCSKKALKKSASG